MPDEYLTQRFADSLHPQARRLILSIISDLSNLVSESELTALLETQDVTGLLTLWGERMGDQLFIHISSLTGLFVNTAASVGIPTAISLRTSFTANSPRLLHYLRSRAGVLITAIAADTLLSIRSLLATAYTEGIGARALGRQVRLIVGLLPQHTAAVARYADLLHRSNIPEARLNHMISTYAHRLHAWRAENIARTELIAAATAGQLEAWQQMVDDGLLDPLRFWVEWVVTEDDRLCPLCAPLDGQRVRLGSSFVSDRRGFPEGFEPVSSPGSRRRTVPLRPDPLSQPRDHLGRFAQITKAFEPLDHPQVIEHPPLHPQCRCALRLRFA